MENKEWIPRNEYPRPQLRREDWTCLNGQWEFALDLSGSGIEREFWKNGAYPQTITVPFCPESKRSGIGFTDFMAAVWYRRKFSLTEEKLRGRVLLHFGAVDYHSHVWINGIAAGEHRGGYTPFTLDITALAKAGENEIVVCAEDDIRSGRQAGGKQSWHYASQGCFYTRTTGIWQTVWLECVPESYIRGLKITPDAMNGSVEIEAALENGDGAVLSVRVREARLRTGEAVPESEIQSGRVGGAGEAVCGKCAATTVCAENAETAVSAGADAEGAVVAQARVRSMGRLAKCTLTLEEAHLWTPETPYLYDLELTLEKDGMADRVQSYFGLRTVEWRDHKFYLNGKPLFMRMVLDQGFYPDGIYTAPDDAALARDILLAEELGFNGARMHEKVFEERYLYHADRLGYLVWGEYGNWGLNVSDAQGLEIFLPEWMEAVARDYSHPALIGWCPFNETFDEPFEQPRRMQDDEVVRTVYRVTKALDPTRPVIDTSGFYHVETDIYDVHDYEQYPQVFYERYGKMKAGDSCYDEKGSRQRYDGCTPLFMSEYGGTYWTNDEEARAHIQQDEGWKRWKAPQSPEEVCERYVGLTKTLLGSGAFCGFCYTQLTDIEQEINGLYTYDRKRKFSEAIYNRIREANRQTAAIEKGEEY